ncbi:MAG: DNA polymerase III subunit alpha [Thermodesulfovibrionales bacterium]|nr:DNA polymerase III subunit alpha [Thermodesulfovibrionales bacterium]
MQRRDFVHLHLHTEYSLLDGAIKIDELIEQASQYEMPALAITDHGNIFGAIKFYREAKKAGIKPIIGCEVYVAPGSRYEKTKVNLDKNLPEEASFHLVLLVKDVEGYKNLTTLLSKAYIEGFYYKPRIDKEILRQYNIGLIALSACLKGEIPYYLQHGKEEMAINSIKQYLDIFGKDNFFIEIQNNGLSEQIEVNKGLIKLSKKFNIPLVATNDCHYLKRDDAKAHDILLCIQTGKTIKDTKRLRFETEDCYFKSQEEMANAFRELPESLRNTLLISERCNLEFDFNKTLLPTYKTPDGIDPETFLEQLTFEGLKSRFKGNPPSNYIERLKKELAIIKEMGYSSYFLIVWDFISYAKKQKISVGPGRGSAAGSLVAYSLGITEIDPIRYNLLFERFLNPERISMPDIDVDFCKDRRQEVINYVAQKYGPEHVAQIITFGTLAAKAAIRDVGRALNIPYAEVDRIAKLVPENARNIEEAINSEIQLRELYENNQTVKEMLDIAKRLEGLARHASTHAAGVVIAPTPLTDYTALYKNPSDNVVTTQFDMTSIEKLGLLKFDFLALKTLTIIEKTLEILRRQGKVIDLSEIPLEDSKTYELLISGNTTGIFQLESSGMRDILVRMQPSRFEELMALVALYRPGPMAWIDDFIKRKRGETEITYELPQLKKILEETYGIILYQEQVMLIANEIANFTMGQADILRRAMGKKKLDEMERQKEIFIEGAAKNKIPKKIASDLFDRMVPFALYGFNKSHSAAYAFLAYRTAYLKAHFPLEFMTANLSLEMGDTDRIVKLINDCRNMSLPVLPPDINKSEREFTIVENAIRFGLEAVKGVGSSAIDNIISTRMERTFTSFRDFLSRIDGRKVNKKVIESLIKSGAFDSLFSDPPNIARAKAMRELESPLKDSLSLMLFGDSIVDTPIVKPWNEEELLYNEKESLGFYISGHPLLKYRDKLNKINALKISDIEEYSDRSDIKLSAVIRESKLKAKEKGITVYLTVEDETGIAEIIVFSELYKRVSPLLKPGNLILVHGIFTKGEKATKILAKDIQTIEEAIESEIIERYELNLLCNDIDETLEKLRYITQFLEPNSNNDSKPSLYLKLNFDEYRVTITSFLRPNRFFKEEVEKIVGKTNLRTLHL